MTHVIHYSFYDMILLLSLFVWLCFFVVVVAGVVCLFVCFDGRMEEQRQIGRNGEMSWN